MLTRFARSAGSTSAALALSALACAQPNIQVRIENVVQTPGQDFRFESTEVGDSRPLIVVVRNIGSADLVFPSNAPIFLAGGFSDLFGLIQPPLENGNKLSPNGSTAFRVDFQPTIPKANMATVVSIPTNDPISPNFSLNLIGLVPTPELALVNGAQIVAPQTQVNIAPTPVGQSRSLTLRIENRGVRELVLTDPIDVSGGFGFGAFSVVQPLSDTIPAGEAVEFAVVFAPLQTGAVTAQIGLSTNDIGNFAAGRFLFAVRSVGQAPADNGNEDQSDDSVEEPVNEDENGGETDTDTSTGGEAAHNDSQQADDTAETGNDQANNALNDAAIDDAGEETIDAQRVGLCGFGMPLGAALGLASLSG